MFIKSRWEDKEKGRKLNKYLWESGTSKQLVGIRPEIFQVSNNIEWMGFE